MAFSIPNKADAFHANQAKIDAVDLNIVAAASGGTGVLTGCAVTAQGSPDMTVAVASGTVLVAGTGVVSVSSGNVTITAADATNPRFDLITVGNTGTKAATAGTAAANPVFPAIPSNSVVLAAVYVPANDTTVAANQIVDKRAAPARKSPKSITKKVKTSGHFAIAAQNPTAWVDVDNTTFDTTIAAEVGDLIGVHVDTEWTDTNAIYGCLDAMFTASSRYFSGGTGATLDYGFGSWMGIPSRKDPIGGEAQLVVEAGDISGGNVTVRMRGRSDHTSTTRTLAANSFVPMRVRVTNYGPVSA